MQHFLLSMPSQAFEASFAAYLHVASLSVSVLDGISNTRADTLSMSIDTALGFIEQCEK